jgi:TolA-binding protein
MFAEKGYTMKTYLLIIVCVLTAAIALADEARVVYDHSTGTYSAQPVNQLATTGQDPGAERFAQLQKQLSSEQTALANLSGKMRDNGHDQKYKRRIQRIKAEMKSLGYSGTGVPAPIRTGDGIYTPKYREPPVSSFTTPVRTAPTQKTP